MSKILTVVGATGAQGGSVVASALKSGEYKVRGITRNVESVSFKALTAQGVDMVAADTSDLASLVKAFEISVFGSHAIFVVTDFFASFATKDAEETVAIESTQGINCAKAASKTTTLEHYIWSTLPDNQKISNGKCSVPHFESKTKVDEYIRQDKALLAKTTFLFITYYATNILMPMFTPTLFKTTGKHVQLLPVAEDTPITTLGATVINTGIYVLAILQQPQLTLPGRTVLAETETRTARDIVKLWSEVSRIPAEFASISLDHYDALWPKWGREVGLMLQFWHYARQKSWIAEDVVIKEDLGISGLVDPQPLTGDPLSKEIYPDFYLVFLLQRKLAMDEPQEEPEERRRAFTCTYCRLKKIKWSKRDKPRRDLEERLARMESLLELFKRESLPSSEQDAISLINREQQSQFSNSAEATRLGNSGSMPYEPVVNADQDDDMEVEPPESIPTLRSLTIQETTQKSASTSSLAQSQTPNYHTSPQTIQNFSPHVEHVECADLLGSEVGWEYHGPTSFLSICSIPGITWVSETSGEPSFFETAKALVLNIDSRLKMRRHPRHEAIAEPDESVAWEWCQAYFDHSFDASLGLVSKEQFEARLRHHFAQKDMADDDPAWYALRNTVYASGYRLSSSNMPYSNMSGEIQGQAWRYFEKALDVHTELLYGSTGLMAVQALTAMGFFAEGLAGPSLAYMLVSCATRLAQAKGLHRQPAQSWNLPLAKQQHRVRLFWTLYILEKHISYRSGRPSIIDDDDISCPFPSTQLADNTTHIDPFIYIIQHARISSRIAKQLASGRSFRQTHSKTLEVIHEFNKELQEWRDTLPQFLQPDAPTTRLGKCPEYINMYHVIYLRYAYYGSIMAIHSILTHPWNSSLFGSGQSPVLRSRISISSHAVVNAARAIILDTDANHVDASTPIWLAFYFPLELASPDTALPFVREIARLARSTVESVKNSAASTGSLLGADVMAPSVAQPSLPHDLENNSSPGEDMLELFSDNWGTMFTSLNDENLAAFTFD
ncbi:hypothetical protein BOTNAR_0116g00120 [Botryotinia narcissicola]|uniref:Xylanolytic transcriptional activator regulatory domain-containing protein n=1 Tax=Botryotinia narcissicola TaxID=278944 RepID=A0A4Z1ILQ5_9HELO|nr:hypothetical protein BOTNAR_0116g00120 [Botryotinia narcissicola]